MNPRGRHAAGPGQPADEPWAQTSDRACWRAFRSGYVLTVTRRAAECWIADIEGKGVVDRAPSPFRTRSAAQVWAETAAERRTGLRGSVA
jgi:hypothetical protein